MLQVEIKSLTSVSSTVLIARLHKAQELALR